MSFKLKVYPGGIEKDVELVGYVHGKGCNDVQCVTKDLYTGEEYKASARSIYLNDSTRLTPLGFGKVA